MLLCPVRSTKTVGNPFYSEMGWLNEETAPPRAAGDDKLWQPCVDYISASKRRRMRDRQVAVRHAFLHSIAIRDLLESDPPSTVISDKSSETATTCKNCPCPLEHSTRHEIDYSSAHMVLTESQLLDRSAFPLGGADRLSPPVARTLRS